MKTKSLGFIGGGRVTKIFLQAFSNKHENFKSVSVYDTNADILSSLKRTFPDIITVDSASIAAKQDYVFISLHPPVIIETLEKIQNDVNPNNVIISLAPKISIEKIIGKLNQVNKVIRLIPNATSYINEGYNPVCFSTGFPGDEKESILKLLGLLGHTFEVSENKLESYAIMSAMLPTYFWFQWKELIEIGTQMGLNENECSDSIQETINASLNLMFKSGLTPAEVMNLIPVKPIGEHEVQITEIYRSKLIALFEKIKP
jgi:pyrroline-5-carboxylate reductase